MALAMTACNGRSLRPRLRVLASPAVSRARGAISGGVLCDARPRRARHPGGFSSARDVRADPLLPKLPQSRHGDRCAERRPAGPVLLHLHARLARGRNPSSAAGSDCGIANVNIGPSGAEIRGRTRRRERDRRRARVGPQTPGRATCAEQPTQLDYGTSLPLAQGVKFEVED